MNKQVNKQVFSQILDAKTIHQVIPTDMMVKHHDIVQHIKHRYELESQTKGHRQALIWAKQRLIGTGFCGDATKKQLQKLSGVTL